MEGLNYFDGEDLDYFEEALGKADDEGNFGKISRQLRVRVDCFKEFNDREFYSRYRFDQKGVMHLTDLFCRDLGRPTKRMHPPSCEQMMCMTLKYLSSCNFLQDVGDMFGFQKRLVLRVVDDVVAAIVAKAREFINLPEGDEAYRAATGFQDRCSMPGIISAIDGTHVKVSPPAQDQHMYINRKGFHSINVQVMCDDKGRFTHVFANIPGRRHDAPVLKLSSVWGQFESNPRHEGIILGDNGYPLRSWLLVPFKDPECTTAGHRRFNLHLSSGRVIIENAIGQLKSRFLPLRQGLLNRDMSKCCDIILACCVLHNLAKELNLPDMDENSVDPNLDVETDAISEEIDCTSDVSERKKGETLRNKFLERYFTK